MITVVSALTEAPSSTAHLKKVPATGAFTSAPPAVCGATLGESVEAG